MNKLRMKKSCFWQILIIVFPGIFITRFVIGQPITLEEALEKARQNSPMARMIRSQYEAEMWRYKANRALLLPQLSLNAQVPGFTRTINQITQPDGSILFRPQSQNFSSATLSLSQNLLATGGTLSLNSGLSRIDLYENVGSGTPSYYWRSAPLFLSFSQPLFRINSIRWNWNQQQINYSQALRQQLESQEDLNLQIIQKYFDLLISTVQWSNAQYNLQNNDTIYLISKGRFGIGKIAENELLQVELGLMRSRNALERFALGKQTAESELKNLIGQFGDKVQLIPSLPNKPPSANINPDQAKMEAFQNRSDLKSLELDENRARMNLQSSKISRRFTADLNLSVGYNQTATDLNSAFQNLQSQQSAFVGINVPLHNSGRNKALVMQAEADLASTLENNANQKNRIEIEVINQVLQINQLRSSLEISAKADTIAQQRYEIAKNRYLIGKIDITNLTIAQQEKDDALITYLQNLQNYWLAWYRLRRSTLFDFQSQNKISPF